MTKRVAMKFRVSSKGQKDGGTSLLTQEERAREYAAKTGYEVAEALVIREVHSGTQLDCPGMIQLKQAAKSRLFDVLLLPSFDRLYRPENVGDEWKALELMAFFNDNGVTVEFVDGSVPADPRYAAVASIFAGMNSGDYRRKMLEATHRGTIARVTEGKFTSRPPFGYCKDSDGRLAVDEEEAKIVRMIFDMYDRERLGVRKIQVRLTGSVLSPSGKARWHQSVLHKILRSDFYWSGRHPLGKSMGVSDGVPCPVIVAEDQGKRVLDRLTANRQLKKGTKSRWALQGRVRCSCGGNWKAQSERPGRAKAQYFCFNRYSEGPRVLKGGERCEIPRRDKAELEVAIFNGLCNALQDYDHLAACLEVALKGAKENIETYGVEIAPLQDAIADTEQRLANVDRARINGRLSEAELDAKEKELLETKNELEQHLSALDPARVAELEEAKAMLPMISELLGWAETYKGWPITKPPEGDESESWWPRPGHGSFTYFKPAGGPPVSEEIAQLFALLPPEWWIGDQGKFMDDDWAQQALTEMLDRLHAKITMYDDHAQLEGVLPLSIPLDSGTPPISLHASQLPRELEGG